MIFDPFSYRYPSRRNMAYGKRGMVATSNPLAAAAGMDILKKGGNAVDAAIAAAAALTVVEPTSNGIGSDAFAIIWKDGRLSGLNGSGSAPAAWSVEKFKSLGLHDSVPARGWLASTVPGAPGVWAELSARMGSLPLTDCLAPAILYAADGYAVSVNVSLLWERAWMSLGGLKGEEYSGWFETFCPGGRAPRPGEIFRSLGHAYTLEQIACTGAKSFYSGEVAEKILNFSSRTGGFYSGEDLVSFKPEWTDPISVNYRGYDVWEMPPNGQGIVVLIALNILKGFDFAEPGAPWTVHRQVEAIKMAFADARRYVADQKRCDVPVRELISDAYADSRRGMITGGARNFEAGDPYAGGTVYLCTADCDGNMVSYIQSNFEGFGSGVVVPGTGIALNNRGKCFSLDPSHPNALESGKRPYNTIIPGFLTKESEPVGPFGVMGAYMQPQGHVQVVMNCVDFQMNPQEALDAPRWQWTGGMNVSFEPSFDGNTARKLARMGHNASIEPDSISFGRGQIIWRTDEGTLAGGAEPRTDGCVEAW